MNIHIIDDNIKDITILILQEKCTRYELLNSYDNEINYILDLFTSYSNKIKLNIKKKDDDTFTFCKSLIKTIYYLSTNTEFLKDVTLYIGGEWISYMLLGKHIYDKDIIVFPSCPNKYSSKNKLQEFIFYLKNIGFVKSFNKITNMYKKEYIEVTMELNKITKTVRFYYHIPCYEAQINMLTFNYKNGIGNITNLTANVLCTNELLDTIYNKEVLLVNDSKDVKFDMWDYKERINFGDKLVEISKFKYNGIMLSCYSPKFIYNDMCCICCIDGSTINGPIIQLKCSHKICIDDLRNHISYVGPTHSKCPSCRAVIDIEMINMNNIETIISNNDDECFNDSMQEYFFETNTESITDTDNGDSDSDSS